LIGSSASRPVGTVLPEFVTGIVLILISGLASLATDFRRLETVPVFHAALSFDFALPALFCPFRLSPGCARRMIEALDPLYRTAVLKGFPGNGIRGTCFANALTPTITLSHAERAI